MKSNKDLLEENKKLKEALDIKIEEYNELRERFKAISASYCFCLGTDFD